MPSNSVPFLTYGILQLSFGVVLFFNFILTVSSILSETDEASNKTGKSSTGGVTSGDLVLPSLLASTVLLLASFVVLYILTYQARTVDLAGNLRIRKRTASFMVAILSWLLTSIETMLKLIALVHFREHTVDNSLNAPWWSVAAYHILLLLQTSFQLWCLRVYEKNTRLPREGQSWLITRKSFLILMAFMNCYFWVLNVAKIKILVDLNSVKVEKFFSPSVDRIIYTLNRASTLAYHVESAQLFYKFYMEDSISPINDQYEDLDHEHREYEFQIVESDSSAGLWLGFFMFGVFLSFAVGSFLVRTSVHDIHYMATLSTVGVMVTIFCITLKTAMSVDNIEEGPREQWDSIKDMCRDITSYLAGEQVGHLRLLLFYSICAVSYHVLITLRVSIRGGEIDVLQPVREGCKAVACISLTVFMFWMSHKQRRLRCWRDLNVMFWMVTTLLVLELTEETFEHDNIAKDPLQVYALPLAIDFKTYVIIHTYSDTISAKNDYQQELRRDVVNLVDNPGNENTSATSAISILSVT